MAQDFTVDRNSSKWVLGSDGYLKEYANDEPAIEFNADGSYKGVLVEPQSINLCLQSEDFGTTWTNDRIVLTDWLNQLTAPDGTTSADKLIQESGQTIAGYVRQSITFTASTYTISVFAKKGTRNWIMLRTNATGATRSAWFNTDTGSLGSVETGLTGNIVEYPNDWYRCSITLTAVAGSEFVYIYNVDANNSTTVADDGGYQYVWGAQLELSPIATSYIPTTTGAVTRVADEIYLTSASSLIGQTEGTLFVEVDWQLVSGYNAQIFSISDGTANNRFLIFKNNLDQLKMYAEANAVSLTNQGESSTAYTGIQKIAFAYKTDDFELYRNGSSVSSDTSGSLAALATLTDVDFGQAYNSTAQANMWIRAVALFTTRLSDAEAYSLTGYDTYAQMANALQYTIL